MRLNISFIKVLVTTFFLLIVCLFSINNNVYAEDIDINQIIDKEEVFEELSDDLPTLNPAESNIELFAAYVDSTFEAKLFSDDPVIENSLGERYLHDNSLYIYRELRKVFSEVASGKRSSVKEVKINLSDFNLTYTDQDFKKLNITGINSEDEYGIVLSDFISKIQLERIDDYLLRDCVYDLYWYDKTKGMKYKFDYDWIDDFSDDVIITDLIFSFSVSEDYRNGKEYLLNTSKTSATLTAVNNAKDIIASAISLSDIEKLEYYKSQICDLVNYNNDAIKNNLSYGDPWQIIYVFDKDPTTNVVCEGYSKAFQYLVNASVFEENIESVIVDGYMRGISSNGPHMWNNVRMPNGFVYLTDITNSDEGSIGQDGELFLAATNTNDEVMSVSIYPYTIEYTYSDYTKDNLSSYYLAVSKKSYNDTPICKHLKYSINNQIEATCTESGMSGDIYCDNCNGYLAESLYVPAKGHSYIDYSEEDDEPNSDYIKSEATCINKAIYYSHCIDCGIKGTTTFEYGEPIDCTPAKAVNENVITANCKNTGSHDEVVYCSVCNKELERKSVIDKATGDHNYITVIDKQPTNTEKGLKHDECTVCGDIKDSTEIPVVENKIPVVETKVPAEIIVPVKGSKVTDTKTKAVVKITVASKTNGEVEYLNSTTKNSSTIVIPETVTINGIKYKVTSIKANAFKNNRKLKKITIGKNIEKIGKNAFYGCKNLKTVNIKTTKLKSSRVGSKAFKGINAKAKIKVPAKKLKAYKTILKKKGITGKKQKITK